MTVYIGNRIAVQSSTSGTGTFNFSSALTGYQKFTDAAISAGTQACYTAVDSLSSPTQWEIGIGTVGTSSLTRDTVEESSNSDAKVNFSSNPYIFCAPSRKHLLIFDDASNLAGVRTALGIGTGSTVNIGALQVAGTARIAADGVMSPSGINIANTGASNSYFDQVSDSGYCIYTMTRHSDDVTSPQIYLTKYRGTAASPADCASGDVLGVLNFRGFAGSVLSRGASISAKVEGTPSATSMPSTLELATTPAGGRVPINRVYVSPDGTVNIATGPLQVAGTTRIAADGTGNFTYISSSATITVASSVPGYYSETTGLSSPAGRWRTAVSGSDEWSVQKAAGSAGSPYSSVTTPFSIGTTINLNINTAVTGTLTVSGNTVWHAGNDGAGSALDAGKLAGCTPPGPYANDSAAATGGVAVGEIYIKTGNKLATRMS